MGLLGGWRQIGGYPGQVGLNRLCTLMLEDVPDVLQLLEGCLYEVGWHATFDSVCQIDIFCYDPFLGCDFRVGDVFILMEHRV